MARREIALAARIVAAAKRTVALSGAGISVDSGIPDFRSPGGLWERYNPFEYATIDAFLADPAKVWRMLHEMHGTVAGAEPNAGHKALAEIEGMGKLEAVITQNIDNLHQAGGSGRVIELHGNGFRLVCIRCRAGYTREEAPALLDGQGVPHCRCGAALKPDVVFFGENLPPAAIEEAFSLAESCDVLLVVGTSGTVVPASHIPYFAKRSGATVVEFNLAPTVLGAAAITDVFIQGSTTETLPALAAEVRRALERR